MRRNHRYQSPAVVRVITFVPESRLLAGSMVDNIERIESVGQDLTDFTTDDPFVHNWEDND